MSYRVRDVRCLLGYAGLLPFILALLASHTSSLVTPQLAYYLFASYSLLIASFMCGALWGRVLDFRISGLSGPQVFSLLLLSNLLAWFVFSMGLLGWQELSLVLMITIYIGIYLAEKLLFSHQAKGLDDRPYMNLRVRLTAAVIVFHGLALIFLANHSFSLLAV